jgi:hypothetical protein
MVLAMSEFIYGEMNASGINMFFNIVIRSIIFVILLYIIKQMCLGKNWARITLTVLLGGIGTLSLVIEPITLLMEGYSLNALEGANLFSILFSASRVVHLASIIMALVFMYQPSANAYFRTFSINR